MSPLDEFLDGVMATSPFEREKSLLHTGILR